MLFIKNEDLKFLLSNFFRAGCNAGQGFDHEVNLIEQENEAFEKYYEMIFPLKKNGETDFTKKYSIRKGDE